MAEEQLHGFTAAQVARLKRIADAVESDYGPSISQHGRPPKQSSKFVIGVLESAVAGTSALIPTAATVGTLNVYSASSTGFSDTGVDEEGVLNLAIQDATTDRITLCARDSWSGRLLIITQFCS